MSNLASLTTYVTENLRRAWRHHCAIIRLAHELDNTSDRGLAEIGVARGDIDDVARGRYQRS